MFFIPNPTEYKHFSRHVRFTPRTFAPLRVYHSVDKLDHVTALNLFQHVIFAIVMAPLKAAALKSKYPHDIMNEKRSDGTSVVRPSRYMMHKDGIPCIVVKSFEIDALMEMTITGMFDPENPSRYFTPVVGEGGSQEHGYLVLLHRDRGLVYVYQEASTAAQIHMATPARSHVAAERRPEGAIVATRAAAVSAAVAERAKQEPEGELKKSMIAIGQLLSRPELLVDDRNYESKPWDIMSLV